MVPVPSRFLSASRSHRYLHVLFLGFSSAFRYALRVLGGGKGGGGAIWEVGQGRLERRDSDIDHSSTKFIVFVVLIPALVLLSGLFAGLTLGYMSLDETQLNVLSVSGTPQQREYASKIKPIRKNGHLLLVTLLLANMIVNESLPIIADPVLGGGVQSVVVSTVLIVIFSEIIPQSLFTRHGLYLGAKMAGFTRVLIYTMGIIAWPVAKFLEFVLGSHHGIIYRRAELKELIALHSSHATHGGDLKLDTVAIIGATLDLQEKVVKQAMTPINEVFMLSIDSKLDYRTLRQICETGHSRVPVYEEIDIPIPPESPSLEGDGGTLLPALRATITGVGLGAVNVVRTQRVKKILGIFLVKHCVMLDPKDATPIRNMPLNKVPFVPNNEPLLGILDKFQEGRSHMAIVSRFSVQKAQSVKQIVKRGLTQRLMERVGMGDTDSASSDSSSSSSSSEDEDGEKSVGFGNLRKKARFKKKTRISLSREDDGKGDIEEGDKLDEKEKGGFIGSHGDGLTVSTVLGEDDAEGSVSKGRNKKSKKDKPKKEPKPHSGASNPLEQSMPADAVLAKEGADEFLQNFEPAVMPLGIITLEDVLEELIGEEIYDEFDAQGAHGDPYRVPTKEKEDELVSTTPQGSFAAENPNSNANPSSSLHTFMPTSIKPIGLKSLGFLRPRSAPPVQSPIPVKASVGGFRVGSDEHQGRSLEEKEEGDLVANTLHSMQHSDVDTFVEVSESAPESQIDPAIGMPVLFGGRSTPVPRAPSPLGVPPFLKGGIPIAASSSLSAGPQHATSSLPRSNSPAPSLEAVLLERKRRLGATTPTTGGTMGLLGVGGNFGNAPGLSGTTAISPTGPAGGVTGAAARMPHAARGTTFKSSPLSVLGGGGDPKNAEAHAAAVEESSSSADKKNNPEN